MSPYMVEVQENLTTFYFAPERAIRVVGAAVQRKGGALLLLPPLQYDSDKFECEVKEEDGTTFRLDRRSVPVW